ncbi:unnamed protein product [Ixodes pacificus]
MCADSMPTASRSLHIPGGQQFNGDEKLSFTLKQCRCVWF